MIVQCYWTWCDTHWDMAADYSEARKKWANSNCNKWFQAKSICTGIAHERTRAHIESHREVAYTHISPMNQRNPHGNVWMMMMMKDLFKCECDFANGYGMAHPKTKRWIQNENRTQERMKRFGKIAAGGDLILTSTISWILSALFWPFRSKQK